ncbi:MAG: WecB/TagA/CpsF family glycosyltransferase, partial [Colwellia sp.]
MNWKSNNIFGIDVDFLTQRQVIEWALAKAKSAGSFEYIVTPNVDHVVRLNNDHVFKSHYSIADVTVCDSRVIKKLAKITYGVNIPLVTGSDLTAELFNYHLACKKITIIGGSLRVISKLKGLYEIGAVSHYNPPMGFYKSEDELLKCVDFVRDSSSDFIFLCVGSPQQEVLANRIRESIDIRGVGFCVGASLLFLTGEEKRAPKWIQKLALEWLYRLISNPRRLFKRYLVDDIA